MLVATLVAAWYAVSLVAAVAGALGAGSTGDGAPQPWAWVGAFWIPTYAALFVGPPIVFLLGLLGTRRRYSTASRIVGLLIIGGLGLLSIWAFMSWSASGG